jgi:hypothetical protein
MELPMANDKRTELQQEVVDALLESRAIDFEAVGGLLARFGERAAKTGSELGFVIGRRVLNYCIPPDPFGEGLTRPGGLQQQG